jgi:hypothetical protein
MHLDPPPALRPVVAAAAPMIRRQLSRALANLAARASSG